MSKSVLTCYGLWSSLGVYRGVKDYNKQYNKDYKFYMKYPDSKKPEYYYTSAFGNSVFGFICYANPILLPVFAIEELYELEKTIRGIEDE